MPDPIDPPPMDVASTFDFDKVVNPRYRFTFAGKAYDFEPFALADQLRPLTDADDPQSDKFAEHVAAARQALGLPAPGGGGPGADPSVVIVVVVTFWRWLPQAVRALGEACGVRPKSPTGSAGTPTSSDASPPATATP